jgi:hypothetical protein
MRRREYDGRTLKRPTNIDLKPKPLLRSYPPGVEERLGIGLGEVRQSSSSPFHGRKRPWHTQSLDTFAKSHLTHDIQPGILKRD